jgi:hypothetical protein
MANKFSKWNLVFAAVPCGLGVVRARDQGTVRPGEQSDGIQEPLTGSSSILAGDTIWPRRRQARPFGPPAAGLDNGFLG